MYNKQSELWKVFIILILKIAVEFNGEQHYKFIPYFHKDIETFEKQRDRLKEEKCNQNNIKLICVPYYLNNSEIKEFIKNKINHWLSIKNWTIY